MDNKFYMLESSSVIMHLVKFVKLMIIVEINL